MLLVSLAPSKKSANSYEAMETLSTPQSRELRLAQGVLHGDYESVAYDIYSGNAKSLLQGIVKLELLDELHQSKAVERLKIMLVGKMAVSGGVIGIDELNHAMEEWHINATLDSWEQET